MRGQVGSVSRSLRILVVALCIFVAKAFFVIPVYQRGIEGAGLYKFIAETQFYELAFFTLSAVLAWSRRFERLGWASSIACACGAAFLNIGLLIVDIRSHSYASKIEQIIQERYIGVASAWMLAVMFLTSGILAIWMGSREHGSIRTQGP
jgi:hypothetical protein